MKYTFSSKNMRPQNNIKFETVDNNGLLSNKKEPSITLKSVQNNSEICSDAETMFTGNDGQQNHKQRNSPGGSWKMEEEHSRNSLPHKLYMISRTIQNFIAESNELLARTLMELTSQSDARV